MKFTLPQRAGTEIDLLPASLFVLLLFLLIPLVSARVESEERSRMPRGQFARPPAAPAEPLVLVRVLAQGGVQINGDDVPADGVLAALQRERVLLPGGLQAAEAGVLIRADRSAPGGRIQEAVKAAQEARFTKFLLEVPPTVQPTAIAAPRKDGSP